MCGRGAKQGIVDWPCIAMVMGTYERTSTVSDGTDTKLGFEGGAFSCATTGLRGLRADDERARFIAQGKGVDGRSVRQN